ncbi:MAG: hypothetical protein ABIK09_11810 [Pseudomonadota bacterium]
MGFLSRATSVLLVLVVVAGCGGVRVKVKTFDRVQGHPQVRALVLLPSEYMLREMRAYDVFEKDLDAADHLSLRQRVAVYAADEYRILAQGLLLDLRNETSLPVVLEADGLATDQAVAIRFTLTENVQEGATVLSGEGREGTIGQAFRSTLFLEIEAYHVGSNQPLATVSIRKEVDPFREVPDHDDTPWHREILLEGLDRLLVEIEDQVRLPGPGGPGPVRVLASAAEAVAFSWGALGSLKARLATEDDLMRDATVLQRVRYRHPKAPPPLQRRLSKLERGLLVDEAPACAGLRVGDVLLEADGVALARDYQWTRILRTRRHRPLEVTALREGREIKLSFDCPAEP